MKKIILVIFMVALLLFLAGCTASANAQVNTPNSQGQVAGFWQGLWHGFIMPITFVISLFNKNVGIYEVHNNGNWYNFGIMFGLGLFSTMFGGGAAARRRMQSNCQPKDNPPEII